MPSKSLYWHTFGSLSTALREAGFDVAVGEERLERAIAQGAALARRVGRLPKFSDWQAARRADSAMLTEWQVYRMFESRRGAWATFQFLVRERLLDEGATVGARRNSGVGSDQPARAKQWRRLERHARSARVPRARLGQVAFSHVEGRARHRRLRSEARA